MATLTVTGQATANGSNGILLRVYVLTGALPAVSQSGATWVQSAAAAHQATASTTVTGSMIYGACLDGSTSGYVYDSGTTSVDQVADTGHTKTYITVISSSATGTPGSVTFGLSAPSDNGGLAALEILPSGAIATDGSSPAVVSTTSAQAVTTASFTPPPGSLLVALLSSNGTSSTVVSASITDSLGLNWISKATANASNMKFAGVWIADVPNATAPAPQPGGSTWRRFFVRTQQPVLPPTGPVQGAISISGSGTLTYLATQGSGSGVNGSGAMQIPAVQGSNTTMSGLAAFTGSVLQGATVALNGVATLTGDVIQGATAACNAVATLAGNAIQIAGGTLSALGSLGQNATQVAGTAISGLASLAGNVVQLAPAALNGVATLAANSGSVILGTASMAASAIWQSSAIQGAVSALSASSIVSWLSSFFSPSPFDAGIGGTVQTVSADGTAQTVLFDGLAQVTSSGGSAQLVGSGGSVQSNSAYYNGASSLSMATKQDLVSFQGNDTTYNLSLTQYGVPFNLTGATVKLYVKATETVPDSSATVYTTGSGLTVTAPVGGQVSWVLPHTATGTAGQQWWRIDVTTAGGSVGTFIYGNLYIIAV